MGTSLSGLTPATTFDGLLKVGDNDPLTATLKPISTGDGTDTMLELSTSALQIGGATGMYWDNTNKRLGLNDVTPTSKIDIKNTFGASALSQLDRMGLFVGYTSASFGIALGGASSYTSGLVQGTNNIGNASGTLSLNPFGSDVGVGSVSPTAKLHIKGSGATSATTSLLVQNSAGSELFKLTDDGNINLGEPGAGPIISAAKNSGKSLKLGNQAHLSAFDLIQLKTWNGLGYNEAMRITGNTDQMVSIGEPTPTARLHVKGAGNTSADYALKILNSDDSTLFDIRNDSVIRIAPNSTNAVSFRNAKMQDGNAVFGTTTIPASTRMTIKGQGATSATTSLLVQNSDGTDMLFVTDDKIVNARQNFRVHHNTNSSRYVNIGWGSLVANDTGSELSLYGGGYTSAIFLNGSTKGTTAGATGIQSTGVLIAPSLTQSSFAPSAQLHVKGAGATSATTALLIQNSSGTDIFKVADSGAVTIESNLYTAGDYRNIGRNSLNSIRFASGETRAAVQGTSSANRFHVYSSSTATSIFSVYTQTQQVGIGNGNTALESTAKLQVDSTTQGFLPPRMTGEQIDAIESPASGLIIYNTTSNKAVCYNGTSWNDMF